MGPERDASDPHGPPGSNVPGALLHDKTAALDSMPEQVSQLAEVLSSRTRLQVLRELTHSREPLHINELARRVGVEASPVRVHLELLVKAGLAREVDTIGRERKFETDVQNVRITVHGGRRARRGQTHGGEAPKEVRKLEKKLADVEHDMHDLESRARILYREIDAAWSKVDNEAADERRRKEREQSRDS
ncbi:MAG: helix-turn-helix domain-containing protein [Thermoplasmatota archaeon]